MIIFIHCRLGATCPSNYNPADYFIQLLAVVPGKELACRHAVNRVCDMFENSKIGRKIVFEVEKANFHEDFASYEKKKCTSRVKAFKATWWEQFRAVLWRSWLSVIKEPILIKVRLLQTIVSNFCNN